MSYTLNTYLNYIFNRTIDDKDPSRISGWNKSCDIKWKNNAYCKVFVRSGDTISLTNLLKNGYYNQFSFFVHMHILL